MTSEIARVVAGMLSSDRMFSIGNGEIWLPIAEDVFVVSQHIQKALELHGYTIGNSNHRIGCGVAMEVAAEEISEHKLRVILSETHGYEGRIAGFCPDGQWQPIEITEPGNILEIPKLGWTGENSRVVIGEYSGLYLSKIHSTEIEVHKRSTEIKIEEESHEENTTLRKLASDHQIIVKRREWSGYPQQTYR